MDSDRPLRERAVDKEKLSRSDANDGGTLLKKFASNFLDSALAKVPLGYEDDFGFHLGT